VKAVGLAPKADAGAPGKFLPGALLKLNFKSDEKHKDTIKLNRIVKTLNTNVKKL
jgi:hypothetical protein